MWVCRDTHREIADEGDGGSCGQHFHPRREQADGYTQSVWVGPMPGSQKTDENGFSTLYPPFKRRVEGRETPPPSEPPENTSRTNGSGRESRRGNAFSVVSLGELRTLEDPPVSYVVDGLLVADGTSLWAAKPKVGKTITAFNLAHAVATGSPFLGRRTARGTVLILALEERRSRVKAHLCRLADADAETDARMLVHTGSAPDGALDALGLLIVQHRPTLVIIDTVAKFARFRDINDYAEVVNKLEPLTELARQYQCHIAMTAHLAKLERVDGTDEVLGSTALTAAVDTIVLLKRATDGTRSIASIQREGDDLAETVLTFSEAEGRCSLGDSKDDARRLAVRAEIVALLTTDGLLSEVQIRELSSTRANDISRALRELLAEGTVVRYGSGRRGDPYRYGLRASATAADEEEEG